MTRGPSYADALADPDLLGGLPAFADLSTWRRWIVFLKALEGLPLDADEQAIFCAHTGRTTYAPPARGWPEALALVGRQSGKSRIAGVIQAVEAIRATSDPIGRGTYCATVAQDSRSAQRAVHAYAVEPFDLPRIAPLVVGRTTETLTLTHEVRLAVYPCRAAAIRGIRARVVVLDEASFFFNSEQRPTDVEVYRAARPSLLTTGGRLVIVSSAYWQSGLVFDLFKANAGRDDSPVLVWKGSSCDMNPTIAAAALARLRTSDPEAYESEINAEFRSGLSLLFDPEAVEACVEAGVRERPRVPGATYVAGADFSGGRKDAAALAIAHRSGDRAVLDVLRVWPAPHDPAQVAGEIADTLKPNGLREVHADAYGADFATSALRAHGIELRPTDRDRSALYLALVPLINSRRAVLLEAPRLLRELRGLERRRGHSGHDRVDHRVGSHDDAANAAAIALTLAARGIGQELWIVNLHDGTRRTARQAAHERRAAELGLSLRDPFLAGDPVRRGD